MSTKEALAGERDYLLASLADLEREHAAGDVDDDDYATLRAGYVARAAELLRELDRLASAAPVPCEQPGVPPRTAASLAARPRWRRRLGTRRARRLLIAGGCLCAAGVAVVLAASLAGLRLPGQTATGTVSLPASTRAQQDLDAAAVLGSAGQIVQAVTLYQQVLALEPGQPQALANLGWLDRLVGRARHDEALVRAGDASIARAVARQPSYAAARAYDGIALLEDRHDVPAGLGQLRAFLGDRPSPALLDALGPSIVSTFRAAHQPVPAPLVRFERAAPARRAAARG